MDVLLLVAAVLVLAMVSSVLVARRVLRALGRTAGRLTDRARVTARAYGPGPAAEVARLRRDLDRSLAGARRAVAAARAVQSPLGDAPSLVARLELAARAVDGELRMLEGHPDPARVTAGLAGPRQRATVIITAAADLVDGLLRAAGYDSDDLDLLQVACSIEADALRAAGGHRHPEPPRSPRGDRWR